MGILVSNTNKHRRKWSQRKTHLSSCQDENWKIIPYSCTILETKLQNIPRFKGMKNSKIDHLLEFQNLIFSSRELANNTKQCFHHIHFANNWWLYKKKKLPQIHFPLGFMGDQDHIFLMYLMYLTQTMICKLLPHLVLKQYPILH